MIRRAADALDGGDPESALLLLDAVAARLRARCAVTLAYTVDEHIAEPTVVPDLQPASKREGEHG